MIPCRIMLMFLERFSNTGQRCILFRSVVGADSNVLVSGSVAFVVEKRFRKTVTGLESRWFFEIVHRLWAGVEQSVQHSVHGVLGQGGLHAQCQLFARFARAGPDRFEKALRLNVIGVHHDHVHTQTFEVLPK